MQILRGLAIDYVDYIIIDLLCLYVCISLSMNIIKKYHRDIEILILKNENEMKDRL